MSGFETPRSERDPLLAHDHVERGPYIDHATVISPPRDHDPESGKPAFDPLGESVGLCTNEWSTV